MQNGQNEIFLYGLKMPTYKFHDYESNQVFEDFLTIEEKERLLARLKELTKIKNELEKLL